MYPLLLFLSIASVCDHGLGFGSILSRVPPGCTGWPGWRPHTSKWVSSSYFRNIINMSLIFMLLFHLRVSLIPLVKNFKKNSKLRSVQTSRARKFVIFHSLNSLSLRYACGSCLWLRIPREYFLSLPSPSFYSQAFLSHLPPILALIGFPKAFQRFIPAPELMWAQNLFACHSGC